MKKKFLSVTLAAVLALTMAGCGGTASTESNTPAADASTTEATATEESSAEAPAADASASTDGATKDVSELKLAFIVGTMNDAFYQTVAQGIQDECSALGIPEPTISDQELDGSKCTDLINTYVAGGYDGIAFSANDPAGTVPAMQQAAASGVAMFTFDCTVDDQYLSDYISFVGSNNKAGGVTAGEYVAEHAPEGSVVGCITYASAQSTQDRQAGFEETIQAAIDSGKDLTLIESQDADNEYV